MQNFPIFIFGYGRSGTNWLLNILNLHGDTHCRNEPNKQSTSLFKHLPLSDGRFESDASFETLWDDAVDWACTHYGERDRMPRSKKNYLYDLPFDLGMWRILEKQKIRLILSPLSPSLASSEWRLPWWLGPRHALEKARPVLKIVAQHNWCQWAVANRSDSHKIHIIRHPGGVMLSWAKRYLALNDPDKVLEANINRLKSVIDFKPEWGGVIGDLTTISVKEAEMWFWRYSTEELFGKGQKDDKYLLTIYEKIIANPLDEVRKIYEFCDLTINDEIIDQISPVDSQSVINQSVWYNKIPADSITANRWRDSISEADLQIIEKVLDGSSMQGWWD